MERDSNLWRDITGVLAMWVVWFVFGKPVHVDIMLVLVVCGLIYWNLPKRESSKKRPKRKKK